MAAPRKYPDELSERAIRFAVDPVEGGREVERRRRLRAAGDRPGLARNCVQQVRIDAASSVGPTADERARLAELAGRGAGRAQADR